MTSKIASITVLSEEKTEMIKGGFLDFATQFNQASATGDNNVGVGVTGLNLLGIGIGGFFA